MVSTADGLTFGAEHTPQEWMDGYAWAMALDDDGNVFWHYNLPDLLNRRYAPTDVARFAHWYLADYPVFCWTEDYGLFVTPCLRAVCGNTIFTARPRSSPT